MHGGGLHVGTALVAVLLHFLVGLQLTSAVAELAETVYQLAHRGLVGIVGDGHGLGVDVGFYLLHTFLKAQIVLYLQLAVVAVHLGGGGHYYGLDVLGQDAGAAQHEAQNEGGSFHLLVYWGCCYILPMFTRMPA